MLPEVSEERMMEVLSSQIQHGKQIQELTVTDITVSRKYDQNVNLMEF